MTMTGERCRPHVNTAAVHRAGCRSKLLNTSPATAASQLSEEPMDAAEQPEEGEPERPQQAGPATIAPAAPEAATPPRAADAGAACSEPQAEAAVGGSSEAEPEPAPAPLVDEPSETVPDASTDPDDGDECSVCLCLLCEPVSLGCGHTFWCVGSRSLPPSRPHKPGSVLALILSSLCVRLQSAVRIQSAEQHHRRIRGVMPAVSHATLSATAAGGPAHHAGAGRRNRRPVPAGAVEGAAGCRAR